MAVETRLVPDDLIPDRAIATAEEDEFRHREFARIVADAVRAAPHDASLNVALFGAWGSGKSSVYGLLVGELRPPHAGVPPRRWWTRSWRFATRVLTGDQNEFVVVRYDAWKYGGEALRRHFISQVSTELGLDPPNLYAVEQSAHLPRVPSLRGVMFRLLRSIGMALLLFALAALVLLVTAAIHRHTGPAQSLHEFKRFIRKAGVFIATSSVAVGVIVAWGRASIGAALVRHRQDPPADEELEVLFDALLDRVRRRGRLRRRLVDSVRQNELGERRFVFFIDELDRCASHEVAETLSAIRTFLEKPGCVFIVAADRDVLEEALPDLPQQNPVNESAPYYSSASEFLDKVFQTQFSLPPLRIQRRTYFAKKLVSGRSGGVWHTLSQHNRGRTLDAVIYALIPAHVQSPRRIKILLNAFAVNARVTEARNIDWLARATEIAKLTTFQIEFPLLARDLAAEPRLPKWLLQGVPDEISPESRALFERHNLDAPPAEDDSSRSADAREGTDLVLVGNSRSQRRAARERLIKTQRDQLRRYLQSRKEPEFPNPQRDLLYLETIGGAAGLEDPELAAILEVEAPERPDAVRDALKERDEQAVATAIRILATLLDPEPIRPERLNIVESLLLAAGLLRQRPPEIASLLASVITRAKEDDAVADDFLPLVLELAVEAGDEGLADWALNNAESLADAERIQRAAMLFPGLSPAQRDTVAKRLIEEYPDNTSILEEPLKEFPEVDACALLDLTLMQNSAELAAIPDAADGLMDAVGKPEERPALASMALDLLLAPETGGYTVARAHSREIVEARGDAGYAGTVALRGFAQAAPADWAAWLDLPTLVAEGADAEIGATPQEGLAALASFFSHFAQASEDQQKSGRAIVSHLCKLFELTEDVDGAALVEAVATAANVSAWSTESETQLRQRRLHAAIRAVGVALPFVADTLEEVLQDDLVREMSRPTRPGVAPPNPVRVARATDEAPLPTRLAVADAIGSHATSDQARTRGLLRLASAAVQTTPDIATREQFDFADEDIAVAVEGSQSALEEWLKLSPTIGAVSAVVEALKPVPVPMRSAICTWLAARGRDASTEFVLARIERERDASRWIAVLGSSPLDHKQIIDKLISLERTLTQSEERVRLAKNLTAFGDRLDASAQKPAADFILALLRRRTNKDFAAAVAGITVLREGEHGKKRRLETEIAAAARATGQKVPRKRIPDLAKAGLDVAARHLQPSKKGIMKRAAAAVQRAAGDVLP